MSVRKEAENQDIGALKEKVPEAKDIATIPLCTDDEDGAASTSKNVKNIVDELGEVNIQDFDFFHHVDGKVDAKTIKKRKRSSDDETDSTAAKQSEGTSMYIGKAFSTLRQCLKTYNVKSGPKIMGRPGVATSLDTIMKAELAKSEINKPQTINEEKNDNLLDRNVKTKAFKENIAPKALILAPSKLDLKKKVECKSSNGVVMNSAAPPDPVALAVDNTMHPVGQPSLDTVMKHLRCVQKFAASPRNRKALLYLKLLRRSLQKGPNNEETNWYSL